MSASYKKLWKQLIDHDMTRTDLRRATGISPSTFVRLSHGDYVAPSVIDRICQELRCDVSDVMEVMLDDKSHDAKMSKQEASSQPVHNADYSPEKGLVHTKGEIVKNE